MTTRVSKGDVFELQRPMKGEQSPTDDDVEIDMMEAMGTTGEDSADMHRLGRKQELKASLTSAFTAFDRENAIQRLTKKDIQRNFHSLSTVGLTCIIMGTWLGMIASSTFSLINGGRAGTIWIYIITWAFQLPVIASIAEMSSMAPSSAGQYHWVSEFAPPSKQKYLSYVSGWLSALGWQANIASTAYTSGQFILILASMKGQFEPKAWQGTVLTMAFALFSVSLNIFGAKHLPLFEGVILFFNIVGFFAVMIPLWVLAPKAPSSEVWTSFSNGGDWSSVGAACIIGILTPAGSFIGADSAAHMSEEVRNASLSVPRVMMFTVMLNGVLGFIAIVTFIYSIQSIEQQIIGSTYAFPYIGIFADATNSYAGAIGMTIPWAVLSCAATINSVAAGSRQAWAFARDDGLPFSRWMQKITVVQGTPIPVNSMLASLAVTVVLSFIILGSSEAFNSIAGLLSGAIGFSYAISIGCVLWRRLYGAPLPPARWSLGRWGVPINAVGCAFEILVTIMSFFPLMSSVTPASMNWGSTMFGGVAILSSIYYFASGRKRYTGPVVHVKQQ